jgi:hypothetical protein
MEHLERASDPAACPAPEQRRPATHAPHLTFERRGRRLCSCVLFGEHIVLLAGADGAAWCDAALRVANRLGICLVARRIGPGGDLTEVGGRWPAAYGVSADGAVLVCRDGFVRWRAVSKVEHHEQALVAALSELA